VSCHPGKALMGTVCKCCTEDCKECTNSKQRNQCTACHTDSYLTVGNKCKCKKGVRHNITNECESKCPAGLSGDFCDVVDP
jgi:hypothetical protein